MDQTRSTRLIKRLSTLSSVGLPPPSLSDVALRSDATDGSDPLVENMLRALIHADSTPRSDSTTTPPLSPTVLGLALPAGRVETLPEHTRLAQLTWDDSRNWGSGFAQISRTDSPTAVLRRRLSSIRCAPASPSRRVSPYLRPPANRPPANRPPPRQAARHRLRPDTVRFSVGPCPLSPLSPSTARANRQRGWGCLRATDLILNAKGCAMVA